LYDKLVPRADGKIVDGPDEMRKAVREEIKYGSDWIKVQHSPPVYVFVRM
jgi:hypothetical protein